MARNRTEELQDALRRLLKQVIRDNTPAAPIEKASAAPAPLMLEPSTPFEALLHQQMLTVEQQLQDLRGSMKHLFLLVVGTVALQAILRVAGF